MIIKNAIRCNICGDVIESTYRHDFKWCKCGNCAVDGGKNYLKRCFKHSPDDFEELSIGFECYEYTGDNLEDCDLPDWLMTEFYETGNIYYKQGNLFFKDSIIHKNDFITSWKDGIKVMTGESIRDTIDRLLTEFPA